MTHMETCASYSVQVLEGGVVYFHCRLHGQELYLHPPAPEPGRFAHLPGEKNKGRPRVFHNDELVIVPKTPGCKWCKRALHTACARCGGPSTDARSRIYSREWRRAFRAEQKRLAVRS
jgi:hypothetical protein